MALKKLCWILNFVLVMAEQSYIELYDETNFEGNRYVLYESADNLAGAFNDRGSSFKVRNQGFLVNFCLISKYAIAPIRLSLL